MIFILSHADSDGRFGSYAAWSYFRQQKKLDQVVFHEVQYGKPFPLDVEKLTKEDEVYIIDFSYKRPVLDPVYVKVGKLVVLDHHESSQEDLVGAPYGFFDLSKSGALLAWEYFFPEERAPLACLLVNDYDMWHWHFEPHTSAFEAWIRYDRVGQNWEKWHELSTSQSAMDNALERGKLLHNQNLSILHSFTSNPDNYHIGAAHLEQLPYNHIKKTRYVVYNGNQVMISELAQAFYKTMPVDATIDWRCRGAVVSFSVRSPNPAVFSAKEFCVSHGGGGHKASASFSLPRAEAFAYIEKLMTDTIS